MISATKSNIYFFFETPVTLLHRNKLKEFIRKIFKKEKKKLLSLNYIFCTDKRVLEINQQYLKHNFYTDIISFELSPKQMPAEGEIYISIDRVKDNARIEGQTISKELLRVIFHGALHLCGYGDKTSAEKKIMRAKEDYYIKSYLA